VAFHTMTIRSNTERQSRNRWDKPRTDMLTYGDDKKREVFRAAMEQAREDGLSLEDMASMITAAKNEPQPPNGVHPNGAENVIYEPGELPEGLIDLPSASKKYGIKVGTLRQWVHVGKLPRRGRMRARAPGGGYIVTEEAMIVYCRDNPRKPWHKKSLTS